MTPVIAMYTNDIGQENDVDGRLRWALPYEDPYRCLKIQLGGSNLYTPKRPFKLVYVDQPLIGANDGEIRDHYGLNCIGKKFWHVFEELSAAFRVP